MAAFFKGNELYRIAMQMERNGLAFYNEIARLSDNEQARAVYQYLATSEKRHLRTFKKLLGGKELSAPQSYKGEFRKYIKVLLKDRVFPSSAIARSRAAKSGPSAAIRAGITAEKDSILFYTELLDLVPPSDRTALDKILLEEKRHLRRLAEYKETGCI
jgi:rubrerythrin